MTDYQKFLRESQAIAQGLVGTFNDEDKYVISEDIIQEFVDAKKMLTSYKDNEALCELHTPNSTFKLKFRFTTDEINNKKYASLYLLETFSFFDEKTNLETFLINYNADNDNNFLEKLKKDFNLTTRDESQGKDIKNTALKFETIVLDKKAKQKAMTKDGMELNKKYVMDVLKILKASGQNDFVKQFKKEIAKLSLDKDSPEYWLKLKNILDKILYKDIDKLSEKYQKMMKEVNEQFILMYRNKLKSVILSGAKPIETKKPPIIPQAKKKAASKGGGKPAKKKTDGDSKSEAKNPVQVKDATQTSDWNKNLNNSIFYNSILRTRPNTLYGNFGFGRKNKVMFGIKMNKFIHVMSYINNTEKNNGNTKTNQHQPKVNDKPNINNNVNPKNFDNEMEFSQ